jgi:hypothetical protein
MSAPCRTTGRISAASWSSTARHEQVPRDGASHAGYFPSAWGEGVTRPGRLIALVYLGALSLGLGLLLG